MKSIILCLLFVGLLVLKERVWIVGQGVLIRLYALVVLGHNVVKEKAIR